MSDSPRIPGPSGARVAGLDLMRAAAISLVLIHHLVGLVVDRIPALHFFNASGPLGVDLFFALSGYLIGRILLGLDQGISRPDVLVGFWSRRWLRTLPLYYLILAVHVTWAVWRNGHVPEIARAAAPYVWFGQSLTSRAPLFFGESWSLAVEEWFYLLFPLAWALLVRLRVRPSAGFLACAGLMFTGSLGLRLLLDPNVQRLWYYDIAMITVFRMDSIAFGIFAAALSLGSPGIWERIRNPAFFTGLLLLGADWALVGNPGLRSDAYMLVWHFTVTGLGCALLLPKLSGIHSFPSVGLGRVVSAVALWSYGLYLVNALLLAVARYFFIEYIDSSLAWAWFFMAAVLAASLAAAAAFHRWVEQPIMDLRRRLPTIRPGN